MESER